MKCKVCALPTWVIICEFPSPFARIRKLPWWSPSSLPVEVAKEWDAHAEGWISGESTWRQFFRFRGSVCCGWMLCWTRRILLVTWSNHGGEILGATKKKKTATWWNRQMMGSIRSCKKLASTAYVCGSRGGHLGCFLNWVARCVLSFSWICWCIIRSHSSNSTGVFFQNHKLSISQSPHKNSKSIPEDAPHAICYLCWWNPGMKNSNMLHNDAR